MKKLTANDPETKSTDLVAENIARLKALFPELVTEGPDGAAVNVDVLKALVGDKTVTDCDEKYGLNWHGKRRARQLALTPSTGTLRPCPEDSVDWDTTQNLMIEGDNLEVLKLLQKSYAGKVKLIYIDPPYNTGKDFVYPDDFQDNIRNYLELTGQVEGGRKISSNTEASGRFHTDWLNMMYPRLKLARNLLREDGVIVVSTGDHELKHIQIACNEIFGEENLLGCAVRIAKKTSNKGTYFAPSKDYLVVYARSPESIAPFMDNVDETYASRFKDQDERGHYATVGLYQAALDPMRGCTNQRYWIECPDGSLVIPPGDTFPPEKKDGSNVAPKSRNDRVWRWTYESYFAKKKMLVFKRTPNSPLVGTDGSRSAWNVYTKYYLEDRLKDGIRPRDYLDDLTNDLGTSALKTLGLDECFDFPKPPELIQRLATWLSDDDGIYVDFFAGSGTTGHAVMAQNAADGGNRRYILVQLPEPLDPENKDQKTAADFCDKLGKPRTIAELTKERLRRAGKKIKEEHPDWHGDTGFRVFKLDSSNIRTWEPNRDNLDQTLLDHVEHIKDGRTEQDILYELLLKLGLDLCVPIETKSIARGAAENAEETEDTSAMTSLRASAPPREPFTVYSIGGGVLMACLATELTREDVEPLAQGIVAWHQELAPASDTTCVFRDSAFADDVAKTNLAAILEQHGIANVRSL
jgi:adenine-specific DNA-methyltransferase